MYSGTSGIRPPDIKPPPLSDHVLLNKKCFIWLKVTSSIRPPPLYDPFFSDIGGSYIGGSTVLKAEDLCYHYHHLPVAYAVGVATDLHKLVRKGINNPVLPESEDSVSSKDWMRVYSLAKLHLDLNRLISGPDCKHVEKPVKALKKEVSAKWVFLLNSISYIFREEKWFTFIWLFL